MADKKKVELIVEQDENSPVKPKVLAQAILDISEAMKKLSKSGLNRKAIITLVGRDSQIHYGTIERVMDSLESLQKNYCS